MHQLARQFQIDFRTIKKYVTADAAWLEMRRKRKVHPFYKRIVQLEAARMTVKKIHPPL